MPAFTQFLIANPYIAIGLAILVALLVHNLLRRQVRTALTLWLITMVVLIYVWLQVTRGDDPIGDTELVQPPPAMQSS